MREKNRELVRSLPLFRATGDETFDALLRGSYLQRFPGHLILIREGEPADFLHVVVTGGVELFSQWNDHEATMDIVRPIGAFILAAVLTDAPYLMSARTIEASDILMIPAANLRAEIEQDPALARAMVAELSSSYRALVKTHKNLKLRSSVERLANFLLRLNEDEDGAAEFILPVEKRTIAALLGMTPENLSRAFATLKAYGVAVSGAQVRLDNLDDLRRLAKPTPYIDDQQV